MHESIFKRYGTEIFHSIEWKQTDENWTSCITLNKMEY